ncbi:MAG: hypothetical protein ACRDE2_16390, partial [Chitinophagaceae bacterium]
ASNSVLKDIMYYTGPHKLPGYIYGLGADLYQTILDNTSPIYKEISDTPNIYHTMAAWYRLAGDTARAEEAEQKSYNTVITQIFKKRRDMTSSTLILNHPYALDHGTLMHPVITDSTNGLTKIYKLYLENPATFTVEERNPSIWFIKPGDSVSLEETYNPDNPSDSRITFKALNNLALQLPNFYLDTTLYNPSSEISYNYEFNRNSFTDSTFNSEVANAFNINEIRKVAKAVTAAYIQRNPVYPDSNFEKDYLDSWYAQMIFRDNESIIVSKYGNIFNKDSALLKRTDSCILTLAADMDHQDQIKTINYWITLKNIYNDIWSKRIKASHYNIDSIEKEVSPFSDTTRQFIYLTMIGDSSSSLIDNNLAWTKVASKIDFGDFQP